MSKLNGDKARFQRMRKASLLRGERARAALAAAKLQAAAVRAAADAGQPGDVPAPVGTLHLVH